ncbi:ATPase V1 complex subunit C [Carpediemonas membranifera]|uniref:V-type proton ATPase subunit C n=1 Tax=Carpediemonas membranifera TaxID=201153 RepID=A0A8J6B582_9EUKA|nr:ATPase V1 complex subunit C [Carpediemonas membranifera]|eukprot:KAG9390297.1 ATPase V1 complex subunit C [Carpediemonas membranifera]
MKSDHQTLIQIAIPAETYPRSCVQTFEDAASSALVVENPFPMLPLGTIDSLMAINDQLRTTMATSEGIVRSVIGAAMEILERAQQHSNVSPSAYVGELVTKIVREFTWDEAKFPTRFSMDRIVAMVTQRLSTIDADVSSVMKRFAQAFAESAQVQKETHGSLQVQAVDNHIATAQIVSTDWLTTRVVAVPRGLVSEWKKTYETMAEYVVPRSDLCLAKDKEYELHRVVLFTKSVDDFTRAIREYKFIMRSWTPETAMSAGGPEARLAATLDIAEDIHAEAAELMPGWIEEAITAAIHLATLAAFVEGVLRHGTPPIFIGILALCPTKKVTSVLTVAERMFGDKKSVYDGAKVLDGLLSFAEVHHALF